MLYFVFTVDGDWEEYFNTKLSEEKRAPNASKILPLLKKEVTFTSKILGGKFIHFIHTSPRAGDLFLKAEFISLWKNIESLGGDVGIHSHEDDPQKAYYFDDLDRMSKSIFDLASRLAKEGINPISFRGGYMAFSPKTIPILEANGLFLDFSCEPGRHLKHKDKLVSDWRGAPENFYTLDYKDHRKEGRSRIHEIPVGTSKGKHLHFEKSSVRTMCKAAKELKEKSLKKDIVVSVLAHTYDFKNFWTIWKMKRALSGLKKFGRFINAKEALDIVRGQ